MAVGRVETQKNIQKSSREPYRELKKNKLPFEQWDFISEPIKRGLRDCGYEKPTLVQSSTIEPALAGTNLIVQAEAGTGKTAAYTIPLGERVEPGNKYPQAIVLTPTKEMSAQVADELKKITKYKGLKIANISGGLNFQEQLEVLEKGIDIALGTPGRILDHIRRKILNPGQVKIVVLDDADEMLSMGFFLEISQIIEKTSPDRQLLLFSSVIAPEIEGLVRQFSGEFLKLMINRKERKVDGLGHALYIVEEGVPRPRNLLYILEYERPKSAMIFCNDSESATLLASYLQHFAKRAAAIHGEMSGEDRQNALEQFKNHQVQYLICTDAAFRDVELQTEAYIINYQFPPTLDLYFYRLKKVNSKGKDSIAISLIGGDDINKVVQLKNKYKIFFDLRSLPPLDQLVSMASNQYISHLFDKATKENFEPYLPLADLLQEDPRGRFIVAYLLKLYQEEKLNKTEGREKKEQTKDSKLMEKLKSYGSKEIKLYLTVGTEEGYTAETLKKMLSEEAGIPIQKLGAVQLERHYSFVNAELDAAEKILTKFQERRVRGIYITASIARRQRTSNR